MICFIIILSLLGLLSIIYGFYLNIQNLVGIAYKNLGKAAGAETKTIVEESSKAVLHSYIVLGIILIAVSLVLVFVYFYKKKSVSSQQGVLGFFGKLWVGLIYTFSALGLLSLIYGIYLRSKGLVGTAYSKLGEAVEVKTASIVNNASVSAGQTYFTLSAVFIALGVILTLIYFYRKNSMTPTLVMEGFIKFLNKIASIINVVAIVALVGMMLLVVTHVVLRKLFASPIPGEEEMVKLLMICLLPCIGVNILAKQCIWVDVFTCKLNRIGQLVIDIITLPASVVILGIMSWQGFKQFEKVYENGKTAIRSPASLQWVKQWPFRLLFFVAMGIATLAALAFTIDRFMAYRNGGMPHDQSETERAIEQVGDLSNIHGEMALEDIADEIPENQRGLALEEGGRRNE